jgi:hypothetical protein
MIRFLFFCGWLWLRWLASRFSAAINTVLQPSTIEPVPRLVLLNIMLQTFDGLATYYGLSLGVQEGNPIMHAAMMQWGVAKTLLGTKGTACLMLPVFLFVQPRRLSTCALTLLATAYLLFSFIPWLAIFFSEVHEIWG